MAALCAAGFECQASVVPDSYLANALDDASDEDFYLLFSELKQRTYTLYCYTRFGTAPLPALPTTSTPGGSPMLDTLPGSFIESAMCTKAEYEASLKLPLPERIQAERAAAAQRR